ncbi:glycoside hydrolase family 95-like protein [Runella sp.]|uniref:glycoside hydrolase family 95-like protein n=1 Tax=Runella sp. TaxID=1960881 RepID=UPI003D131866
MTANRDGFEIVSLEWKNGKISKVVIKSNLGGNCRLRVSNELKLTRRDVKLHISTTTTENFNLFYQTEKIAPPIVITKE